MYTTPWCGYCHRLKRLMSDAGISFVEVDIEQDDDGAQFVMSRNDGDQTVPTLRFADGSTLTNPSLRDVQAKVDALVGAAPSDAASQAASRGR
jgi:mycoredoxin